MKFQKDTRMNCKLFHLNIYLGDSTVIYESHNLEESTSYIFHKKLIDPYRFF